MTDASLDVDGGARSLDGAVPGGEDASTPPGMDGGDRMDGARPESDAETDLDAAGSLDAEADPDADGDCDPSQYCGNEGICVAYAQEHESCADGEPCANGLYCAVDECTRFTHDECPCADDEVCVDLVNARECRVPIAAGELCEGTTPCIAPLVCAQNGGPELRCVSRAELGEPCVSRGCVPGLQCLLADLTCQPFIEEHEPCNGIFFGQCKAPLICAWNDICVQPEQPIGGPCNVLDPESCADGLYCDRSVQTCQPLVEEGSLCNYGWLGASGCEDGLYCSCDNGMCIGFNPDAPSDHEICAPALLDGADCARSDECASRYCKAGKCEPVPAGAEICD